MVSKTNIKIQVTTFEHTFIRICSDRQFSSSKDPKPLKNIKFLHPATIEFLTYLVFNKEHMRAFNPENKELCLKNSITVDSIKNIISDLKMLNLQNAIYVSKGIYINDQCSIAIESDITKIFENLCYTFDENAVSTSLWNFDSVFYQCIDAIKHVNKVIYANPDLDNTIEISGFKSKDIGNNCDLTLPRYDDIIHEVNCIEICDEDKAIINFPHIRMPSNSILDFKFKRVDIVRIDLVLREYVEIFKEGKLESNSNYYSYKYSLNNFSNFFNEQFQMHNNKLSINREFFADDKVRTFEFILTLKDDGYIDIEDVVIHKNKYILKIRSIKPIPVKKTFNNLKKGEINPIKLPDNAVWEKLAIKFLDGHYVLIKYDNKEIAKRNYKEMGFEDERINKPNLQWELLEKIAKDYGEISRSTELSKDEKEKLKGVFPQNLEDDINQYKNYSIKSVPNKYKKRKQELSDALEKYFQIDGKPFYDYQKIKCYKIKIKLTLE